MSKRSLLYIVALLMVAITASAVLAITTVTTTLSGDIDGSDPTMPVVFITPPNCSGQGSVQLRYEAIPFQVDASGQYHFTLGSTNNNAVFYLYVDSFDPQSGMTNCLAADNTYPFEIDQQLSTAHTYILVIVDDHMQLPSVHYTVVVEGPGSVVTAGQDPGTGEVPVSPSLGNCPQRLPSGSVVMSVPNGAPTYFAPDYSSGTNFDLPAGHWWVSETSGDFSKVWIACQASPVWIPTSAIG